MKKLFVFVPVTLMVLSLLNSFVKKEKETLCKTPGGVKSSAYTTLCDAPSTDSMRSGAVAPINSNKPAFADIVFKSTDGGQTWQDIGEGLPEIEQPVKFFAGESDLYLHVKNVMYHSKSGFETPAWEKENVPDLKGEIYGPSTSIVFNRSGVMSYNYDGHIYQKIPAGGTWLPVYTNFKKHSLRSVFETKDGTVFLCYDHGLYKSADKGKIWKQVQEGIVFNVVESDGVLVATGGNGIMRSTDNGEHWQWVISEGGVGIAVERINGGFAAISYNTETQSRRMRISLDKGKTWQAIDNGLRPSPFISSIKQMGKYLICSNPDGVYRSSDMGKTWIMVRPAIGENVFTIYVSGNVLYAVAGSAGC